MALDPVGEDAAPYVSTGTMPPAPRIQALVTEAYERFRGDSDGHNSTVYPALDRAPRERFGICITRTNGEIYFAGDADVDFTIMSVAKPFVLALVCQLVGPEEVRRRLGVNATGLPFNSLAAIESNNDGATNPMVNPGAIATTSLLPGDSPADQWRFLLDGMSRFAGRTLALDEEVYVSASATNHRNRSMAWLLHRYHRIHGDPTAVVDLYTRQSCVSVPATCRSWGRRWPTVGSIR